MSSSENKTDKAPKGSILNLRNKIYLGCIPALVDDELRSFEITTKKGEMLDSNRRIWQSLGIKQSDNALFFPAPNALVPIKFAKFMNKRKVTFVDSREINVSTLISLAADLKLSNVTVKLASPQGKFPIEDSVFDLVYSDLGFSSFLQDYRIDVDPLTKELSRILKPGGRLAALDENGAPVMYPCPQEVQSIRAKLDAPRADKLIMGRRIYGALKANSLKDIKLVGHSRFVTSDDKDSMRAELSRKIVSLDTYANDSQMLLKGSLTPQEIEKYRSWLKAQLSNNSFLIQFNMILAIARK